MFFNTFRVCNALKLFLLFSFVFISCIFLNEHISSTHSLWLIIAGFLLVNSSFGLPIRSLLVTMIIMIGVVGLSYFLHLVFSREFLFLFGLAFVCLVSIYFGTKFSFSENSKRNIFIFAYLLFFLCGIEGFTFDYTASVVKDIFLAFIPVFIFSSLLRPNVASQFRHDVLPLLNQQVIVSEDMVDKAFVLDAHSMVQLKKLANIVSDNNKYPEWAFAEGFNPGLREGVRYFLLQLDWLTDLYFSLAELLKENVSYPVDEKLIKLYSNMMQANLILLANLKSQLQKSTLLPDVKSHDFKSDSAALQDYFKDVDLFPDHSESEKLQFEISKHLVDMRKILLNLTLSITQHYMSPRTA